MAEDGRGKSPGSISHRWQKGQSGNPGGRLKAQQYLEERARESGPENIKFLESVRDDPDADLSCRISAVKILLERGYGKPPQAVHVSDPDGGPVRHQHSLEAFLDELKQIRDRREKTELPPYVNGHHSD